jgi:serine/threonine protein kinase
METIGEYRVGRLLGEGGMGKVFEAEERLSGRKVALKVLRPELARSEPARRLFENEMTVLSRLDHPNIVRCLACAEVSGDLVMALELLEGRTLRNLMLDEGALPWERAVGIVAQMASALSAAHEHAPPIVHRDLKPENVMVLAADTIKVTDFGIAKVLAALGSKTTHSVGTLQYMSPEQIDAGPIDGRSDLYALGLVFYELVAGRPPFESSSPRELLNLQCTAAPPPLPEPVRRALPRGLERLLFELLAKSREDRPASAADVLHELEPFMPSTGREAPSSRPSSSKRSTPPAREASSEAAQPRDETFDTERTPVRSSVRSDGRTSRPPIEDTVALLERAARPREVPLRTAVLVIGALSFLSGLVTYSVTARAPRDAGGDRVLTLERP